MTFIFANATRDHAVFPRRPGVDYDGLAKSAVQDCLELMLVLAESERICDATEARLQAGDAWFAKRSSDDPKYVNGLRTQNKLMRRMGIYMARAEQSAIDLWRACCTLYAALTHIDTTIGAKIISSIGIAVPSHPRDAWDILTGGREPPGHWPPEERDYWIEYRPGRTTA